MTNPTTPTPPAAPPFTVTVTVTVPPAASDAGSVADATPASVTVDAPPVAANPVVSAPATPAAPESADKPAVAIAEAKPPATESADKPAVAVAEAKPPVTPPAPTVAPEAGATDTAQTKPDTQPPTPSWFETWKTWLIGSGAVIVLVVVGLLVWQMLRPKGPGEGFVSSNGRIEATEIDVSSKFGGRLQDILVADGEFVKTGQTLAHMQVQSLEAQHDEALAQQQQMIASVASAKAQVSARESDRQAVLALVAQRKSELDAAQKRLARSETLTREGASSGQELDDDRARVSSVQAAVVAAKAQVQAAQAAIVAAKAQVAGARSTVAAADATIARIQVDIKDSSLVAPRDSRVQYRIAQPGEVLGAGGKVLNLVDLGDVYMTFFVPEASAGKLALDSEVHLILDAAPQYVIPAKISFVASSAQFTPKTVETASERQKLMFRVKAQIDRELLQKNLKQVKTGLPGMVWLKLDPQAEWPADLAVKVPQ
jgi:HlyD family secretion protein